jgi:glycosyltransferase involved in cell wall biosynthesis
LYSRNGQKTVLHVIDTTGPGGAETVFIELCTRLDPARYKSIAVVTGAGWVHDELLRRGIQPVIVPTTKSFDLQYLRKLRAIVRKHKIDLIQSHLFGSNVYSSIVGIVTGTPVVSTFHGSVDVSTNERLKWLKFALLNSGSAKVVFVSNYLKRVISQLAKVSSDKTTIIYNGVDIERFCPGKGVQLRQELGLSDSDFLVGAIGNIRISKAYDILLQAAALLTRQSNRYKFVIVGEGSGHLLQELLALRSTLGLERDVFFIGFRADTERLLNNLDAFVLSSSTEGFSISTIEAMASGIPVIATKSGGPQEILENGNTGMLVDSGSPAAIAEAILRLEADSGLRATLVANGLQHVRAQFSIDVMLDAYEHLYMETLSHT